MTAAVLHPNDLAGEAFFRDPYPTYRAWRERGRIFRVDILGGIWFVPHYRGLTDLLRDERLSHNTSRYWAGQFGAEKLAVLDPFISVFSQWMALFDGHPHARYRKLLNKAFHGASREFRGAIEGTVHGLLDRVQDKGRMDVIGDFAYPLPAIIITRLLGLPGEDVPRITECADHLVNLFGATHETYSLALKAQESLLWLTDYLEGVISERKSKPGKDLISLLVQAEEDGDRLSPMEINAQCSMMLFAGHETTRNLIGNGLLALLSHPGQLAALNEHPMLMKDAVEEMVRYDSPVQLTVRAALEDIVYEGETVRKGELVMFGYGSANHDPDYFRDPDRFDIRRADNKHLGFGVGAHICTGINLAKVEAMTALTAILARMPGIRLEHADPDWHHNAGFRGLKSLPVVF